MLRLILFVLSCAVALAIPFVLLNGSDATYVLRWGGFYLVAGTFFAFAGFLGVWLKRNVDWAGFWRGHRWGLLVVLTCAVFLQLHEPRRFKILWDEYSLVGTSQVMHRERRVGVPGAGHYFNGRLNFGSYFVDKRPIFFPFLVCLAHDLTGYRPENIFAVNALGGLVLLGGIYLWGARLGGRIYGILGVLLMTTLPLLAQNATGGGFDLWNTAMILVVLHLAWMFIRNPGNLEMNLFILGLVLLAQTRYESILFTIPGGALILAHWWREKRIHLTWLAAFSPLLLLSPLLSARVFTSHEGFFQLEEPNQDFFALANIPENFGNAVYYLFQVSPDFTNSPVLAIFGSISLLLLVAQLPRQVKRAGGLPPPLLAFYALLPVVLFNSVWALSNFWGQFDDPLVSRVTLPLHLFFTLGSMEAAKEIFKARPLPGWIPVAVAGWIFFFTVPSNVIHYYTDDIEVNRYAAMAVRFVKEKSTPRDLFIGESTLPFMVHDRASVPAFRANLRPESLVRAMDLGFYENVYFVFRSRVRNDFKEEPRGEQEIMDPFVLELVEEQWWRPNFVSRIYRLAGVKEGTPVARRLEEARRTGVGPEEDKDVGLVYYKLRQLP